MQDPAVDIASQLICAKRVLRRGRFEPRERILSIGIPGNRARKDGNKDPADDDRETDDRRPPRPVRDRGGRTC